MGKRKVIHIHCVSFTHYISFDPYDLRRRCDGEGVIPTLQKGRNILVGEPSQLWWSWKLSPRPLTSTGCSFHSTMETIPQNKNFSPNALVYSVAQHAQYCTTSKVKEKITLIPQGFTKASAWMAQRDCSVLTPWQNFLASRAKANPSFNFHPALSTSLSDHLGLLALGQLCN